MKIVTIGGGTGTFTVLTGLKKYPVELTAIVTMMDSGGSSGVLRDEFGVLPPGDVRQCIVALSEAGPIMRELLNHRFDRGDLSGHNFGNILISTLEQVTGSLDKALDMIGSIFAIRGRVVPVTLTKTNLVAELNNGKVLQGEHELTEYQLVSKFGIKKLSLRPKATANKKALQAIREADFIIVGPGNLYSSIIPNFLVPGISTAFAKAKARKIYVANLMNKHGHTDDFCVADYVDEIERFAGVRDLFDTVIYNTKPPSPKLVKKYADEGEPVAHDEAAMRPDLAFVGVDIIADAIAKTAKKDMLRRTLIRHDPDKLASAIMALAARV